MTQNHVASGGEGGIRTRALARKLISSLTGDSDFRGFY